MEIFWVIVVGFIAGVIAKLVTPGKNEPSGFVLTTILGIAGSFVGTFVGQFFGFYESGQFANFFGQIVGAIILLFLWGKFFNKSAV